MRMPDLGELLVILFVLVLIFGAGKLTPLAERIGRAIDGPRTRPAPRGDDAPAKAPKP